MQHYNIACLFISFQFGKNMLFQLSCNPMKTFGCARSPRSERSFHVLKTLVESCQCHVWLFFYFCIQTNKILPAWLHPLPSFLETHYGVWTGSLATQATSTCTTDSSRCHSLCSATWWRRSQKACWPNHMQPPHQRSATRHGGTKLLPEPQAYLSAGARVTTAYVPASRQRATGRPAQQHTSAGVHSSGSTKNAPLKRGNWGRELHSESGRALVQSSLLREILYFVIFQNILWSNSKSWAEAFENF